MEIDELITPAVLIEERRLASNIARMQEKADRQDVQLRPHVKTHKSPALARRQKEAGAAGITVANVHEAETFVRAGFSDVRLAYSIVSRQKHRRLLALQDTAEISFCVDTAAGIHEAGDFYHPRDATGHVLLEIDVGQGRCGVPWESPEVAVLARQIVEHPGLVLEGILTHAGQVYAGPADGEQPVDALERVAVQERDRMLSAAGRLLAQDVITPEVAASFEISLGSTPTMAAFENRTDGDFTITEVRPGNYVFHDAMQVALGSASLEDCALTVLATVTSKHRDGPRDRVIVDAGKKIFTTDTGYGTKGYGTILYNAGAMRRHPHAVLAQLSEEHGWIYAPGGSTLHVGDPVRILPNHACVTAGMQNSLYLVDGDEVLEEVTVAARGY
jgi:D-serine deaminase-like pyridoxal phosphate-dependent protein